MVMSSDCSAVPTCVVTSSFTPDRISFIVSLFLQPFLTVEVSFLIHSFCHTVGVEIQQVAGRQCEAFHDKRCVLPHAHDNTTMRNLHIVPGNPVRRFTPHKRRVMTAVHIAEDPCANVQHTEELRDEHGFFVVFAKLPVRLCNYGGKIRFTAVCISGWQLP